MSNPRPNNHWTKGVSGNPVGRPKGSKNKLHSMKDDWFTAYSKGGGVKYWEKLAKEDLGMFLKIGASFLPKEVEAQVDGRIEVCWIGEDSNPIQTP